MAEGGWQEFAHELLARAPVVRLVAFLGILALMAILETWRPQRPRRCPRRRRWPANLAMVAFGSLLSRLLLPLGAVGAALWAEQEATGLLHLLDFGGWGGVLAAVVLLDLGIYAQHVAFHRIGWLWRIHRVHHADPDLDTTTGVRFHPLEYVLSTAWKIVLVIAIGADAAAVIIFEILLNGLALFNHADWRMPVRVDRVLRLLVVTPDVHAVHHSVRADEHHRNFGFNLTAWDRLFGTWRERPVKGVAELDIGLADVPARRAVPLASLLALPFRRAADDRGRAAPPGP